MERAYPESLALGIRGAWLNADQLHDPAITQPVLDACAAHEDFRFILFIYLTESRLRDEGGSWQADMRNALNRLHALGLTERCAGVQLHDEWWSALYTGSLARQQPYWPSLDGLTPAQCWALRHEAARMLSQRVRELRLFWREITGRALPPVGMSETGGCEPPEFAGQDWWGLDLYLGRGYYETPDALRRAYAGVWAATRLPLMPVVGVFADGDNPVPDVATLGHTYWPIVQHPQTWAVGVFCLKHPSTYDVRHGAGRGVLDLDPSYQAGVRWLCDAMKER